MHATNWPPRSYLHHAPCHVKSFYAAVAIHATRSYLHHAPYHVAYFVSTLATTTYVLTIVDFFKCPSKAKTMYSILFAG